VGKDFSGNVSYDGVRMCAFFSSCPPFHSPSPSEMLRGCANFLSRKSCILVFDSFVHAVYAGENLLYFTL
jgi:hypothetical protein